MMDKEEVAIERLKFGESLSFSHYKKPLMICYSGGKDSEVLIELAKRSGIKYEVQHSHTTADAPETVRHVRRRFYELELAGVPCSITYPMYKGKRTSMWDLIPQKLMPPTRNVRYCCSVLKETSGKNRVISTGIRRAESNQRNTREAIETIAPNKANKISLPDEYENEQTYFFDDEEQDSDLHGDFLKQCQMQSKISINPIIDWSNAEVWNYLRDCKTVCNPLYQRNNFSRVGCVGCPMAAQARHDGFHRWSQFEKMYKSAFGRMLEVRRAAGKETLWKTGDEVFRWWMEDGNLKGQTVLAGVRPELLEGKEEE